MKRFTTLMCLALAALASFAQETEMTATQAKTYYKNVTKKAVSCHDPSVVWEPTSQRYYIFGSHLDQAYTTDLQNWTTFRAPWGAVQEDGTIKTTNVTNAEAFSRNQVKTVTIGGKETDFGPFDANAWAGAYGGDYNIDGNLWAPDVIYNEKMGKWCMYMSVNGPTWNSVIVLLTSDKIDGRYDYQGPVVYSGFLSNTDSRVSWKKTDLELVIGAQSSLPSRYNQGTANWPKYWCNAIDPCVFYDPDGNLWMSYGSWFGGIWMLQLNEETGLRDYDVVYESDFSTKGQALTSDPYFGKRIAGGYQVSGEASYIERIGNYYYLFMSYGGLESTGGYQMRVFRSENPDGPYKDPAGRSAIYSSYAMNYGTSPDMRGEKILGPYDKWGFMSLGELAQGHNSIIAAPDGRTYLVYHTRFNDGTEGHQVRVHQVFVNAEGWLCAAPFEYNGEETTDADIASKETFTPQEIAGTYDILIHKYGIDHANREVVTPVQITLTEDGKVSGAYTGTWKTTEGTSYISISLGSTVYNGVIVDETMDGRNLHAIAFTACNKSGVCLWGYKWRHDYALAWQINNQKIPVSNGSYVGQDINLQAMDLGISGVTLNWTSSRPDIISDYGKYNPTGLAENTPVDLTARLTSGKYFWTETYNVTAEKESMPAADWTSGMCCFYGFDDEELTNSLNPEEKATPAKRGTNSLPSFGTDNLRTGRIVSTRFGASGNESYMAFDNPLYGKELTDGATVSFWVQRNDNNLWDALLSFYDATTLQRLYLTGNLYLGYNNNQGVWVDINHSATAETNAIGTGLWHLVTITFDRTPSKGIKFYIDGIEFRNNTYNGGVNGTEVKAKGDFDYNYILDHLALCKEFYLGYGSFWGSADASFDDIIVYDRALSLTEVFALRTMENRVCDLGALAGIDDVTFMPAKTAGDSSDIYDLNGRKISQGATNLPHGIYIVGGRKVVR